MLKTGCLAQSIRKTNDQFETTQSLTNCWFCICSSLNKAQDWTSQGLNESKCLNLNTETTVISNEQIQILSIRKTMCHLSTKKNQYIKYHSLRKYRARPGTFKIIINLSPLSYTHSRWHAQAHCIVRETIHRNKPIAKKGYVEEDNKVADPFLWFKSCTEATQCHTFQSKSVTQVSSLHCRPHQSQPCPTSQMLEVGCFKLISMTSESCPSFLKVH